MTTTLSQPHRAFNGAKKKNNTFTPINAQRVPAQPIGLVSIETD